MRSSCIAVLAVSLVAFLCVCWARRLGAGPCFMEAANPNLACPGMTLKCSDQDNPTDCDNTIEYSFQINAWGCGAVQQQTNCVASGATATCSIGYECEWDYTFEFCNKTAIVWETYYAPYYTTVNCD